jgi:hypothetical protein
MPARTDNAIAVEIVSPATSPVLFTIFVLFVISTFRCSYQRHPLHVHRLSVLEIRTQHCSYTFLNHALPRRDSSSITSIPASKVGVAAAPRRQEEVAITRHEKHSPPAARTLKRQLDDIINDNPTVAPALRLFWSHVNPIVDELGFSYDLLLAASAVPPAAA